MVLKNDKSSIYNKKLYYLVSELGLLLKSENTSLNIKLLNKGNLNRDIQFLKLIKISIKDILTTFSLAIAFNVLIQITQLHNYFSSVYEYIPLIEGGLGALIVFITSFNMSYTNGKRANTDLALIDFSNTLVAYAQRLKVMIDDNEKDQFKKDIILNKINTCFEIIGEGIITGTRKGNPYRLRFDTTIQESFDVINNILKSYIPHTDYADKLRITELEDHLIISANKFQTITNIRSAIIFSALNHWVIRITYFFLTVFSPISSIPRLFIVNLMQRSFYNTANETDEAIYNISLATLPIEERVLRRLCRINNVLISK